MSRVVMCHECKRKFHKEELINYKGLNYCNECYNKKLDKENLYDFICDFYNLKMPGPKIYSQRKKLLAQGCTDKIILRTLKYLKETNKLNKNIISLGLVNEKNALAAKKYFEKAESFVYVEDAVSAQPIKEEVIRYLKPPEEFNDKKTFYNPDDFI